MHLFWPAAAAAALALLSVATLATTADAAPADTSLPSDGLKNILARGASVEKLVGDCKFVEGPLWDRARNVLLFSYTPAGTIYEYDPARPGIKTVFRGDAHGPNGNTFDRAGRLLTCLQKGRRLVRAEPDGTVAVVAERYEGKALNSPNDVVVKTNAAVYFTDPPYGVPPGKQELGYNAVFRLDQNGTLTALVRDFDRPNGLAFSPDEELLYVDDTARKHIRVFDVAPDGSLQNGRVFATLRESPQPGKPNNPDGLKVDKAGNVFCTGGGGVQVFAPNGAYLGLISVPETAANCAWGDKDGKTLYITASTSLYRIRVKTGGRTYSSKPR